MNVRDTQLSPQFAVQYNYPVIYTRASMSRENTQLVDLIVRRENQPVILPVVDSNVLAAHSGLADKMAAYFGHHGLSILPVLPVTGGEACKNSDTVIQQIYQAVVDHKIDRHSYIIAMGGGAVIDTVGYAAATAHRGIRLIRMPTTVLAQNDAAVGVKNAINFQDRKNFLGTFAPPHAVLSDFDFLDSLQDRDKRAGIAEAIKVALIKDVTFFDDLYASRHDLALFQSDAMERMIVRGAQWHIDHIASQGDPFEMGSARPLDFGHWAAHKLEALSNHDLRHGEAVAIGIALDSLYSSAVGRLPQSMLDTIIVLLKEIGFTLYHPSFEKLDIAAALAEFKEHLGGSLCITLLNAIGKGVEVNDIDVHTMRKSLERLSKVSKI